MIPHPRGRVGVVVSASVGLVDCEASTSAVGGSLREINCGHRVVKIKLR